jgi:hypothetical protein
MIKDRPTLLERIRYLLLRHEVTLIYRHDLKEIPVVDTDSGCSARRLEPEKLEILHEVWPDDLGMMRARFQTGGECYAGWADGRIAQYCWVQVTGTHELADAAQKVDTPAGHFWIYHCRTADWARGRRLYPCVLSEILRTRKAAGSTQGWIYTTADNISSQKGIERAGFVRHAALRGVHVLTVAIPLSRKFTPLQ